MEEGNWQDMVGEGEEEVKDGMVWLGQMAIPFI